MNICTKYGFDILIISGSYGGHRRHTTYDGRRTTPRVWHKLPTGELKSRQPEKRSKRLCSRLPALIDTPGQLHFLLPQKTHLDCITNNGSIIVYSGRHNSHYAIFKPATELTLQIFN